MCDTQAAVAPERTRRKALTAEEKAAIIADYKAGLSMAAIREKYDYRGKRGIKELVPDAAPIANAPPPRRKDEPGVLYASRVRAWMLKNNPAFAARWRQSHKVKGAANSRKHRRKAERMVAELNSVETRGVWRLARNVPESARRKHGIEVRRVAGATRIYLMPAPPPVPVQPAADIPLAIVAAPPPTLWQRIVGWFR